jgi:hypothetical protein
LVGQSLLILLLDGASRAELDAAVDEHGDSYPAVHVVVPAHVGTLDWLATDESRAHGEAGSRVLEAEWLLEGAGEVTGEVGEADPVLAAEDALRGFPADEIVVVGRGEIDEELVSSLRALGLPVSLNGLALRPASLLGRAREATRSLASGRSAGTGFVAFIGANLGLLLIGLVLSLIGMLVVWLALDVF